MKLTAKVKLQPTPEQREVLLATLRQVNSACNHISRWAWDNRTFGKFAVQKGVYYAVKEQFGLTAQVVVRAIAKVVDAYKLDKKTLREFKPLGAISYDDRILSWNLKGSKVSIWTVSGRESVDFVCGEYQKNLLVNRQGESDLCYIRGNFYLFTTVNVESAQPIEVEGVLGVDLGIVQIATDSDGNAYSGKHLNSVRHRHRRLRRKLQRKGTKSAKRRLKRLSGKERRFASDTNHVISKRIVDAAKRTNRAIALEELTGIRQRVRARRSQRARLHSWAFANLGNKIVYKAQLSGVPVRFVDPHNTSRQCPACGHTEKLNRLTQARFVCRHCGLSGNADHFAAVNISRRAAVNPPNVGA